MLSSLNARHQLSEKTTQRLQGVIVDVLDTAPGSGSRRPSSAFIVTEEVSLAILGHPSRGLILRKQNKGGIFEMQNLRLAV